MNLTPEDIEAVANRVVQKLRESPPASNDPILTREQAAAFCSLSSRTFDRERQRVPLALAPVGDVGPLSKRWRLSTLEMYLLSNGRPLNHPRGRKKAS